MDTRNFTYMFYGFLAAWAILSLYAISLAARRRRLEEQIARLRVALGQDDDSTFRPKARTAWIGSWVLAIVGAAWILLRVTGAGVVLTPAGMFYAFEVAWALLCGFLVALVWGDSARREIDRLKAVVEEKDRV